MTEKSNYESAEWNNNNNNEKENNNNNDAKGVHIGFDNSDLDMWDQETTVRIFCHYQSLLTTLQHPHNVNFGLLWK